MTTVTGMNHVFQNLVFNMDVFLGVSIGNMRGVKCKLIRERERERGRERERELGKKGGNASILTLEFEKFEKHQKKKS